MSIQSVLLPVFVQIALIFVLLGVTAGLRQRALQGGVAWRDVALSGEAFPPHARQAANCYANQFEMPVLFLLAVIFAIVLHQAGWLFVLLEWLFVAARVVHAAIHTSVNVVPLRGLAFGASAAIVACLWALVGLGVFFGVVVA